MLRAWLPVLLGLSGLSGCADVLGLDDPHAKGSDDGSGTGPGPSGGGGGGGGGSGTTAKACTGTTYEGSCYERYKPVGTWMAARDQCEQGGGWLVTFASSNEVSTLKNMMFTGDLVYVGASDLDTPGTFTWLDGTKPASEAWMPAQPDFQQGEHCGVIRNAVFAFGLEDHVCNDAIDYICERPIP